MKILSLMIFAASLSSTATFIYVTRKMDPELFAMIKSGGQMVLQQLELKSQKVAANCSPDGSERGHASNTGSDRSPASIPESKQPNMKELIRQAQESQKEREKFLKELQDAQ